MILVICRIPFLIAVLTGALFAQARESAKEPQFTDYPAPEVSHSVPDMPKFSTRGQRRFRTVIRDWVKKGPNFAGHFTIAEWGCGTGCEQIAVVDNKSGDVFEGPFGKLPNASICLGAHVEEDKTGIFYRADSSLLVLRGCPNDQACGSYYYSWTGTQFKLLRRIPMKTVFGCEP
jgi:hypothetical protein